ncbi:MAG TPA: hypothetical protein VES59_01795 [Bacteroidota bacterium]|nr:hypothetical protein [Bacteroidota bacterium]
MSLKLVLLFSILVLPLLGSDCQVGLYPLLFDGAPITATFRADVTTGTAFDDSRTVDLEEIRRGIDKRIDSIKVFNVSLQIDSTAGTNPSTTLTGAVLINGDTLIRVNGVPISDFATERSIFDSTITGGRVFKNKGVATLIALLKQLTQGTGGLTATVHALGNASSSPLHFTIKLKLYTQVFTPKKG